jgi:hypothetical protein
MLKLNQIKKLKKDPREIEEKLSLALKYYEVESEIDLEKIKKIFNKESDPVKGIGQILEIPIFESKEELESFANLLRDLWNNMPRSEFKGFSLLEWQERKTVDKSVTDQ